MTKSSKGRKRILFLFFLLLFLVQGSLFVANAEVSLPNPSLPNTSLPNPTLPNPSLSDSNIDNSNLSDGTGNSGVNGKVTTNGSGQATEGKEDQGILNWIKDTYTKGKDKLNDWQGKIGDQITEWVPAVNQMVTDSLDWVKENWEVSATTALGIGLLIGGIFFPPLLVLGASVLIGEALSGLIGYFWSGLRGKELTQETAIGGLLGLISASVGGVLLKGVALGTKFIAGNSLLGAFTSVVDDILHNKKLNVGKMITGALLGGILGAVTVGFVGPNSGILGSIVNSGKVSASQSAPKVNVQNGAIKGGSKSEIELLAQYAKENNIGELSLSNEDILRFSGGRQDLAENLLSATKESVGDEGLALIERVKKYSLPTNPQNGSLSLYQTRIWYKWQESLIVSKLDYSKSLEAVARDAFKMRNTIRTQARMAMSDQGWAQFLLQNEKNLTFEELVQKNTVRGLNGDDLWKKIIESSMSSRDSVNSLFGLD